MQIDSQPPVDEFSAAFADLSAPNSTGEPGETMVADPPAENPPAETVVPAADPPAADPPAADPPAADPPAADPPAADPPAADPPAPAPAAETEEATLARLAALVNKAPAAAAAPAAPAASDEPAPLYTEDESKFLDAYEKEWGDVSKAEGLKRRAEYRGLLDYAFTEIMNEFKPIKEMAEQLATRTHYGDIKEAVGEYTNEERDAITSWVGEQPAYLQTAYKSVIEAGTAGEVADLVGRYREAKGITKPAPTGGETELSEQAKQAAAALAPVGSKRTVVQQPDDMSNFDAGWKKFADMV